MLTQKEIYRSAAKKLKSRQIRSQLQQKQNMKIAIAICPEIEQLSAELKTTSIKLMKLILNKKIQNKLEIILKIQNGNIKTQRKIKILLKQNNLPEDFLTQKPVCKICNDYGYVKDKKCDCLKNLIKKITINDLQKSSCFTLKSFTDFDLNLYSKQKNSSDEISEYEQMSAILKICEKFAYNFPNVENGLILYGSTGLGKTHLSLSIASEIIAKNFSVLYCTASEITQKMSNSYFGRDQKDEVKFLNLVDETDLLIIDDLGSEFESNINISAIFETINIRTSTNKPIILNTNLQPKELEKRYGPRIFSRISANLKALQFVGTDNRHKAAHKSFE